MVPYEPSEITVSDGLHRLDNQKRRPEGSLYGPMKLLEQTNGIGGHCKQKTSIRIKPNQQKYSSHIIYNLFPINTLALYFF
jgi:hypothetical protein